MVSPNFWHGCPHSACTRALPAPGIALCWQPHQVRSIRKDTIRDSCAIAHELTATSNHMWSSCLKGRGSPIAMCRMAGQPVARMCGCARVNCTIQPLLMLPTVAATLAWVAYEKVVDVRTSRCTRARLPTRDQQNPATSHAPDCCCDATVGRLCPRAHWQTIPPCACAIAHAHARSTCSCHSHDSPLGCCSAQCPSHTRHEDGVPSGVAR